MLVAAAAAAVNAPATETRADTRGICNTKGIDIFFWPQGHPAIPAIGFPAYSPPHVELYKAHDVSGPAQLAYLDVSQTALSPSQCSSAADTPQTFAQGATTQTTTATQKLRCTFTANADVSLGSWDKVTKHYVTRVVKVHGKKKKRRHLVTTRTHLGEIASVGFEGGTGALAQVGISSNPAAPSMLKWATGACVPVDVAG